MNKTVDIDELHAEINRALPFEHHIQKGDPMFAGIVMNKIVFASHVQLLKSKLEEALERSAAMSEQEIKRAEAISERLIGNAGNRIEQQVDVAVQIWEERLRQAATHGEQNIRRASWLAWIGAALIFISSCIIIGSCLGNFVFSLMQQTKERPAAAICAPTRLIGKRTDKGSNASMEEKRWISRGLVDMLIEMRKYDSAAEVVSGSQNVFEMLSRQIAEAIAHGKKLPSGSRSLEIKRLLNEAHEEIKEHKEWEKAVLGKLGVEKHDVTLTAPLQQAFNETAIARKRLLDEIAHCEKQHLKQASQSR